MHRRRLITYLLAGAALTGIAVFAVVELAPAPATPGTYGIATAGGNDGASEAVARCRVVQVPCPAGHLELAPPFAGRSSAALAFAAFRDRLLTPGGHMRLWVPYDALMTWDVAHHSCGVSRYALGTPAPFNAVDGIELFARLVWDVQGARALGLTPEVVFSAGSGEGAPAYPDPGYGTAGLDYYCGVLGVMSRLRAALGNGAPAEWEAFNEPDRYPAYTGAAGPLQAAELWLLAERAGERIGGQQVAALSVTDPQSAYAAEYVRQLAGLCRAQCAFPRYWAVHDYDDPTAGGTADLRTFEHMLSLAVRKHDPPVYVWVTEAGVEPGSQTRSDYNRGGCRGPEADNSGTLGACVDGVSDAQRRGAQAWRRLLYVSAPGVRTTQVYWFEFQLISSWDSALVDAGGRPRPSFCALVHGFRCNGDADDYLLDRRPPVSPPRAQPACRRSRRQTAC